MLRKERNIMKKLQVTNFELVQIANLIKELENKRFPQKLSYAIMKSIINISKEVEIYTKQLNDIIETYKEEGKLVLDNKREIVFENNGIPKVKTEFVEEFARELDELLNFKVTVEVSSFSEEMFDYDEEGRYDVLTPSEMIVLMTLSEK